MDHNILHFQIGIHFFLEGGSLSRIASQKLLDKRLVLSQNVTLTMELRKSVTQAVLCPMKLSAFLITILLTYNR